MTVKKFFNGLKVIIIFIILFFLSEIAVLSAASIYFKYSNQGILWDEFVKNNSPILTFIVQIFRLIIIALFIYFRKNKFYEKYREDYIYDRKTRNGEFSNILLLSIGILGFSTFLTFVLSLSPVFIDSINSLNDSFESFYNFQLLGFLSIVVAAPLMEELALRAILFRELEVNFGAVASHIISALIFAILHFNLIQAAYAFLAGLFLSLIYKKSQSIEKVIFIHLLNNLISFMMSNFQDQAKIILPFALILYIFSAYYLIKYLKGPSDYND